MVWSAQKIPLALAAISKTAMFRIAAVLVVLALLVAWQFGFVWPGTGTFGVIHVDSPEIYTRERLVNDRYDQDHWLRQKLKDLDATGNLVEGSVITARLATVSVGAPNGEGDNQDAAVTQQVTQKEHTEPAGQLAFGEEFHVKMALRDEIRQQILENMLDDRHDLSGNSVFGLKFDSTIVPGARTTSSAFVDVEIYLADNKGITQADPKTNLPSYVVEYYAPGTAANDASLESWQALYAEWLSDLQDRLNEYASLLKSRGNITCYRDAEAAQWGRTLAMEALKLFGADRSRVVVVDGNGSLTIYPAEFSRFFFLMAQLPKSCSDQFRIHVLAREESLYFIPPPPPEVGAMIDANRWLYVGEFHVPGSAAAGAEANANGLCSVRDDQNAGKAPATNYAVVAANSRFASPQDTDPFLLAELIAPLGEGVSPRLFEFMRLNHSIRKYPRAPKPALADIDPSAVGSMTVAAGGPEVEPECLVNYPLGLFNFIERISTSDSYTYAVFPKTHKQVLTIRSQSQLGGGGNLGASGVGNISYSEDASGSNATSVFIGYGDGANADDEAGPAENKQPTVDRAAPSGDLQRAARFGWIISPPADLGASGLAAPKMRPIQRSEVALVSVPAWAREITIVTRTGWLDEDAHERAALTVRRSEVVPLPTDYEAIDSIVVKKRLRREPAIRDFEMGKSEVVACEPAAILIPGYRLWRSTVVTIGAQTADRITVMPNMQGIIAEFNEVSIPPVGAVTANHITGERHMDVHLQVWTSEGVVRAEEAVSVRLSTASTPDGACKRAP
jgi:hypothetical protein